LQYKEPYNYIKKPQRCDVRADVSKSRGFMLRIAHVSLIVLLWVLLIVKAVIGAKSITNTGSYCFFLYILLAYLQSTLIHWLICRCSYDRVHWSQKFIIVCNYYNYYYSVYSRHYATIVRWAVISDPFLGNGSVNTFPRQPLRIQWRKRAVVYAVRAEEL
jgi:hypothetical protein